MAALPDLTVFAKTLNHHFKGHLLKPVDGHRTQKLNVTIRELQDHLKGSEVDLVQREGKTLEFHFSNRNILGLHLMRHATSG